MSLNSMMIASIAGLSFILGLFFILFFGTSKWEEHLNNEFKAYVYLEDSLNVSQINTTIELLKNNPSFNKKDIKNNSKLYFLKKIFIYLNLNVFKDVIKKLI